MPEDLKTAKDILELLKGSKDLATYKEVSEVFVELIRLMRENQDGFEDRIGEMKEKIIPALVAEVKASRKQLLSLIEDAKADFDIQLSERISYVAKRIDQLQDSFESLEILMPSSNELIEEAVRRAKEETKPTDYSEEIEELRRAHEDFEGRFDEFPTREWVEQRAISILDSRTQYLINKVASLSSSSTPSSGAVTIIASSTAVDDSTTAFVFPQKPQIVVVNGASYRENHGWAWNSGASSAILDNPVGSTGDIYGIL